MVIKVEGKKHLFGFKKAFLIFRNGDYSEFQNMSKATKVIS